MLQTPAPSLPSVYHPHPPLPRRLRPPPYVPARAHHESGYGTLDGPAHDHEPLGRDRRRARPSPAQRQIPGQGAGNYVARAFIGRRRLNAGDVAVDCVLLHVGIHVSRFSRDGGFAKTVADNGRISDAICFSATYVWCGFQTGNSAQVSYHSITHTLSQLLTPPPQLAIALCRLFAPTPDFTFHIADRQALCSLLTFLLGALLARSLDLLGPKRRATLFAGTLVQAALLGAGALCINWSGQTNIGTDRGDPAWDNGLSFACIGFMSASLGWQGVMAKRVDTPFSATGENFVL